MDKPLYYLACLFAVVVLESVPRFVSEIHQPFPFFQRLVLMLLFLAVAWFFRHSLHANWNWSSLSGMFYVEAIAVVCFAILLFLQIFSPWWGLLTAIIIFARAIIYSFVASQRISHLRGLVFFTCLVLLVCGELMLTIGFAPL